MKNILGGSAVFCENHSLPSAPQCQSPNADFPALAFL